MRSPSTWFALGCLAIAPCQAHGGGLATSRPAPVSRPPNILVILADDLGYADVGFNGSKDIPTPHLDRLAEHGVRCTSGYVSHPFCSPTRAGLLIGRYQQRFGHENNPTWLPNDSQVGLPLSQITLAQLLKAAGYVTGAVGKWHLGAHPSFHPNARGFDEYFGILGGGHMYLPNSKGGVEYTIPLDRNRTAEPHTEYLTDTFGREAAAFITRHKDKSWFLYLAFNAPHTPLQATDKYLARVAGIDDATRRTYAAMTTAMDDAIGATMQALREHKLEDDTLVFFFSDNGGPVSVTHSSNEPLRGQKGQVYEGGIRVPFLVSWPARLPQGQDYDPPVSSLDVFATALELAGVKIPPAVKINGTSVPSDLELDGVNLIPYLCGEKSGAPHERLFWRTGGGDRFAVRQGTWKWIKARDAKPELYDLAQDIGEQQDIIGQHPDVAAELERAASAWNKQLVSPLWSNPQPAAKKKAAKKSP